MTEFKRENRYIVIKRKRLSSETEEALYDFLEAEGIQTVECVVIESDWPEYETVWGLIQDRCNGVPNEINQLRAENRDLLMRNHVTHELFETGDPGCPEQALDRNGEVVLGVCKNCGRVEAELAEPCDHRTLIANLHAENAQLRDAIERMRVAGGSQEFQAAFELAKDLL